MMFASISVATGSLRDRALRAALQFASLARNFKVCWVAAIVFEPLAFFLESAVAFFLLVNNLVAANWRVRSHEAAAFFAEHARYVAHRALRELVVVLLVARSGAREHDVIAVPLDGLVARIAWRAKNASVVRRAEVVANFVREGDVRDLCRDDRTIILDRYNSSVQALCFTIVVALVLLANAARAAFWLRYPGQPEHARVKVPLRENI